MKQLPLDIKKIIHSYIHNPFLESQTLRDINYIAVLRQLRFVFRFNETQPSKIRETLQIIEWILMHERDANYADFVRFGMNISRVIITRFVLDI